MRAWRLKRADLPSLILAADARLAEPNYFDDQIWELNLNSGEPAGLTLRTTYGLRALNMRVYHRFTEGDNAISDTSQFHIPPAIQHFYPNYTLLTASPFEGIDVIFEFWVPASNQIGGRIRILNSGVTPRTIQFGLVASLVCAESQGQSFSPGKLEGVNVLTGEMGNLRPVIFLSGGPDARISPTTHLQVSVELQPGLDKAVYWGHAGAEDQDESFQLARQFASRKWEAETARIEMTNASLIDIETGDPKWDMAFTIGQMTAYRLLHGPTKNLPHLSFVQTRLPDQGYSLRGDGSDYDHLWSGQSVLEAWQIATQLLPASARLLEGILENFLATQQEAGMIDLQPSLNGRLSGTQATPLLCTLAWEIYRITRDQAVLIKIFPRLKKFIDYWFSSQNDRDGNGVPEWEHPIQTGYEDNPLFAHWQSWAQGAEISYFESASLTAMLYMECRSLVKMAREINFPASIPALEERMAGLKESLARAWDDQASTYRYLDRDTHDSPPGVVLGSRVGAGLIKVDGRTFASPVRLSIRIQRIGDGERNPEITILGNDKTGQPQKEEIQTGKVKWTPGWGTGVSEQVYSAITFVQVEGVLPEDEITFRTLDYRHLDLTLLTPLWANIPSPLQAEQLVRNTIMNSARFLEEFGLVACATQPSLEAADVSDSIWVPWNSIVGIGMVNYGYAEEAADLVTRLMKAITETLSKNGGFRKHYHGKTGAGIGERDAIFGLPPLQLFLKTLGVQIDSVWRVRLEGRNPYPWPVKVSFRGLVIERGLDSTEIVFPNGKKAVISDPTPCIIDAKTPVEG